MKYRVRISRIKNENLSGDEIRATRKGQEGPRLSCGNFFIEAASLTAAKREALKQAQEECDGIKFKVDEAVETSWR